MTCATTTQDWRDSAVGTMVKAIRSGQSPSFNQVLRVDGTCSKRHLRFVSLARARKDLVPAKGPARLCAGVGLTIFESRTDSWFTNLVLHNRLSRLTNQHLDLLTHIPNGQLRVGSNTANFTFLAAWTQLAKKREK